MKTYIKAYVWTAIASGIIGLLIGMTALLGHLYQPWMLEILLKSILAGVVIGTFCMGTSLVLANNKCYQPLFLFGGVAVLIGAGTAVAAKLISGLPLGEVAFFVAFLMVVAELFGIGLTYANYRHFVYINDKLRLKQEQLRDNRFDKSTE